MPSSSPLARRPIRRSRARPSAPKRGVPSKIRVTRLPLAVGSTDQVPENERSSWRSGAGPAAERDVVLEADRQTFLAWGTGRLSDGDALQAGLRIDGGRRELARFGRLFDRPHRKAA